MLFFIWEIILFERGIKEMNKESNMIYNFLKDNDLLKIYKSLIEAEGRG